MCPLVSVIIPVYKVEPYLRKCVDSVCQSTLKDIEIILVDDGSPDTCGQICDEYALKDDRIRVIHKENGGISSARNAGLDIARSDLIGFVDSDDWVDPDMFEFLYNNLIQADADISVCGVYEHVGEKVHMLCDASVYKTVSGHDAVQTNLAMTIAGNACWNKLYRRHLFEEIRFPEGRIFEDVFIMTRLIDSARKVVFNLQAKYHYWRRPDSLFSKRYRPQLRDCAESQLAVYDYIDKKYPDLTDAVRKTCIWAHFYVLEAMMLHDGPVDLQDKKRIIQYLRKHIKVILTQRDYTKTRKLSAIALCIHESLYKLVLKARKWLHK